MSRTVSVVIPNFNNSSYIKKCLENVLASRPKEVIVVDDASTDNSIRLIEKFPVQLIRNAKNIGPVKARNIGAKKATGDYILFLDGDAMVAQTYLSHLVNFLDLNSRAGVVSGKVVEAETGERMRYNFGYDPNFLRDAIAGVIHFLVLRYRSNRCFKKIITFVAEPFTLNLVKDVSRKVDWVVEMAFMTRRELFEKLGGLDERFFMFYEGPDYCRRVRRAGCEVWYTPASFVTHLGGHSLSSNIRKNFWIKSRNLYSKKYFLG